MRTIITAIFLLLLSFSPAWAQDFDVELITVRNLLELPLETPVKNGNSRSMPDARPLKVYLATNDEMHIEANLIAWIEEWNKGEGAQAGMIEVVNSFRDADLALVRFTEKDYDLSEAGYATPTYTNPTPTTIEENQPSLLPKRIKLAEVAYNFIVIKEPGGLKVLHKSSDKLLQKTVTTSNSNRAKAELDKAMKEIAAEADKRAAGPDKERDAKFNGYKVSDELFRLMRGRNKLRQK